MKKSAKFFYQSVFMATLFVFSSLAHAVEEEAHKGNPGPSIGTLYHAINFLILVTLLFVLLRKPVKNFFEARAKLVGKAVEEARKAHQLAWNQHEEINKKLKNLEDESRRIMASFREEGEEEKKKLLSQVQIFAEKMKQDAALIADGEIKRAKEELKEMAIGLSKDLARKIIKEELQSDDQDRLTKHYLEGLKAL